MFSLFLCIAVQDVLGMFSLLLCFAVDDVLGMCGLFLCVAVEDVLVLLKRIFVLRGPYAVDIMSKSKN